MKSVKVGVKLSLSDCHGRCNRVSFDGHNLFFSHVRVFQAHSVLEISHSHVFDCRSIDKLDH